MPRITLSDINIPDDIIVDVPDRVINGIIVNKLKVHVVRLAYEVYQRKVVIETQVQPYLNLEDNSYGPALGGTPGFAVTEWNLIADDTTLCRAADGIPVCSAADEEVELQAEVPTEGGGVRPGKLYGVDYMGQWEYFKRKAATQQVVIDAEIVNFITYAAWVEGRVQ